MALRRLKQEVIGLLDSADLEAALGTITSMPPRRVVNPLFGALYHGSDRIRWHAVTAMGAVVARLAEHDLESARVIMRRLMWNLNDESGGIGWGSPEAMGEIMACHARLAIEYASILVSYLNPDGNFLEHEGLQEGALWGLARLAHARQQLARPGAPFLSTFLSVQNTQLRGLALLAAGVLATPAMRFHLQRLCLDDSRITLYWDRCFVPRSLSELAQAALASMDATSNPA